MTDYANGQHVGQTGFEKKRLSLTVDLFNASCRLRPFSTKCLYRSGIKAGPHCSPSGNPRAGAHENYIALLNSRLFKTTGSPAFSNGLALPCYH